MAVSVSERRWIEKASLLGLSHYLVDVKTGRVIAKVVPVHGKWFAPGFGEYIELDKAKLDIEALADRKTGLARLMEWLLRKAQGKRTVRDE